MKALEAVKEFYKPIQPAVKTGASDINYSEVKPESNIADFVYCFWQLKTRKTLSQPYVYRVVSDGCIDIFFNHNELTESFVMGFCRKYTAFAIGCEFDYIGIRFLPAAFPLLFGIDAKTISNDSPKLETVLPNFSQWILSSLKQAQTFDQIVPLLNRYLHDHTQKYRFDYDPRFFNALNLILQKNGHLNTENDLETGLSPRQLRRIFNHYIGTTPKAFSNVVRFQYILNTKPSNQSLKDNKVYFDVGFFDQAHFIKNFKTFYGITPSEAFR